MRVSTLPAVKVKTVGYSADLADDGAWATLKLHGLGGRDTVVIEGTPKELRGLGRFIADGMKRRKEKP